MSGRIEYVGLVTGLTILSKDRIRAKDIDYRAWIANTKAGVYDDLLDIMEIWLCLDSRPLWSLGRLTVEQLRELIKNA